jgi:hypothetical protein
VRGSASNEAPANLTGGVKFTASKRPRASDGITRSAVGRGLRLEQDQNSLSADRRPLRDDAPIGFAQRLRGRHAKIFTQLLLFQCPSRAPHCVPASRRRTFSTLKPPFDVEIRVTSVPVHRIVTRHPALPF